MSLALRARSLPFVAAALAAAFASPSDAAPLYGSVSSFSQTDLGAKSPSSYCDACGGVGYQIADQFTLSQASTITSFSLASGLAGQANSQFPSTLDVQVFSVGGDGKPGTLIQSLTTSLSLGGLIFDDTYRLDLDTTDFSLAAGSYYVSFYSGDRFTDFHLSEYANAAFGARYQWRLDSGTPISDDRALGDGGYNTAFAVFGTSATSNAPEPASWALMLIGFGAIGGTLRKRSRRVCFAI